MARFVKVAVELENYKCNSKWQPHFWPWSLKSVPNLRGNVVETMTQDELLANGMLEYDYDAPNLGGNLVPIIYNPDDDGVGLWFDIDRSFAEASVTRDAAIATILDSTDQVPPEGSKLIL